VQLSGGGSVALWWWQCNSLVAAMLLFGGGSVTVPEFSYNASSVRSGVIVHKDRRVS
jgi:hypothetical protein